jgi:hypothetical protein
LESASKTSTIFPCKINGLKMKKIIEIEVNNK